MIIETSDYSIFKKHPSNAPILEGNVVKVMRSISTKNLLKYRPILVDGQHRVLDGQHRLEAAKRLGICIFYEIRAEMEAKDMPLLNNGRSWKGPDYLHHYAAEGFPEYIKLKNFMKKSSLDLKNSLVCLGIQEKGKKRNGKDSFREGDFIFPCLDSEILALEIISKHNIILDYVVPKIDGEKRFLNSPSFIRSLYVFLSVKSIDFDLFMKKLPYKMDILRPQARIKDYLTTLQQIYNWKNQNPVKVEEFV